MTPAKSLAPASHGVYPRGVGVEFLFALAFVVSFSAVATLVSRGNDAPAPIRLTHDGHFKQRPAWSPDGKQLVFSRHKGNRIELALMSADGTGEKTLTTGKFPQYDACWSPDGAKLAFTHVAQTPGQGNLEVYLAKLDVFEPQKFAGDQGKLSHEEYPAWSPDGKWIAYSSTHEGNQELYVADAEGANHRRLTNDPAFDAHPAWSPDGRQIVCATSRWGDFEIAVIEVETGNVTRLTESRGLDDYPVFSPDGRRLAFLSNRDGNYEIYCSDAAGLHPVNITQHAAVDNFPAWTPAGKLGFVSNRDEVWDIYVTTVP